MKRFGIGLAIGFITFLVGMVPSYYPFESLFRLRGGLSHCTMDFDVRDIHGMPSSVEPSIDYVDESQAVYSAVLADEMYGERRLVVSDKTVAGDWFAGVDPGRRLAGVEKETFDGYRSSNSVSRYLGHEMGDDSRITLLNEFESSGIFKRKNGWADFRKRFPNVNGLIIFSSVGLNPTHTQGLVSVEKQCGGLCGEGKFVLLKKVNGRWTIVRKIIAWES